MSELIKPVYFRIDEILLRLELDFYISLKGCSHVPGSSIGSEEHLDLDFGRLCQIMLV